MTFTAAAYRTGIGRIVDTLSERKLATLSGDDLENRIFELPCREVAALWQRVIEIYGPALGDEVAVLHVGIWRTMEGRGAETDATALVVARRGATVHRGRSAGCRQGGGPP